MRSLAGELNEINHLRKADWHGLWHMREDEYVDVHLVCRSVVAVLIKLPRISKCGLCTRTMCDPAFLRS